MQVITNLRDIINHAVVTNIEFQNKVAEIDDEIDALALHRLTQYNENHIEKLTEYNDNDTLKMDQYNANHIERLENINYAYADRIVEMIKTRNFMGIMDEYVPKTSTHMITFLDTTDANYIYYANGTLLAENVDYTVYDSTTIELTLKANPYDVIVQVNTQILADMLTSEGVLFDYMIGQPNGIAGLDDTGKVPSEQLPSYVDDVLELATYADLPVNGETGKIYVVVADETSNGDTSSYRWTGTVYAMVSNTLNAADVKALYEANADTNEYTDAEKASVDVATVLDTTAITLPQAVNELKSRADNADSAIVSNGADIAGLMQSIINLSKSTAKGQFGDDGTMRVELSGTYQVLPVVVKVQSTDTDKFEINPDGSITVYEPGEYSFISTVTFEDMGANGDVGEVTFQIMDTTDDTVYYTESAIIKIGGYNRETVPFNSLVVADDTLTYPVNANIRARITGVGNGDYGIIGLNSIISSTNNNGTITQKHDELVGRDVAESHPANAISVIPQGNLSSDNVQLALEELQNGIDVINSGGVSNQEW